MNKCAFSFLTIPYAVIKVSPEKTEGNGLKTTLAASISKVRGNTGTDEIFDQLSFYPNINLGTCKTEGKKTISTDKT